MKNLVIAAFAVLFAFAANAAEVKTTDGKTLDVTEAGVTMNGAPAADGSYTLEDGKTLVVKEGKEVK